MDEEREVGDGEGVRLYSFGDANQLSSGLYGGATQHCTSYAAERPRDQACEANSTKPPATLCIHSGTRVGSSGAGRVTCRDPKSHESPAITDGKLCRCRTCQTHSHRVGGRRGVGSAERHAALPRETTSQPSRAEASSHTLSFRWSLSWARCDVLEQ